MTLLNVPITVEQNRGMEEYIFGSSLAELIPGDVSDAGEVQIRFRLRDHHRGAIQSAALVTTVGELMKKECH